jgi:hypothetical protein
VQIRRHNGSPQWSPFCGTVDHPSVECGTAGPGKFGQVLISFAILHLLAVIAAYDRERESRT